MKNCLNILEQLPDSENGRAPYKSIPRSAKVLVCLSNNINTVTELARYCNLSKSTVYRLLEALKESRFVTQDLNTRRYYLGNLVNYLVSNPQTTHQHLVISAVEEMNRLAEISEETVSLSILIGLQYIPLHKIPSKHDLQVVGENSLLLGGLLDGASNRVLLSQLNEDELEVALNYIQSESRQAYAFAGRESLIKQLLKVRKQGYSSSQGERIPGALCLSAVIDSYTYPACLNIIGPEGRMEPKVAKLKKEIIVCARRISANINRSQRQDFGGGR
jgi:DNA-binding IclR family transcriptional regulator